MHDRPMPPHACAENTKKKHPCMPTIAATIQQNMYKYANTRKTSRLGNVSGMPKRKRMWSTHGDARGNCVYGCKNLKSVYMHKKNVESEKIE